MNPNKCFCRQWYREHSVPVKVKLVAIFFAKTLQGHPGPLSHGIHAEWKFCEKQSQPSFRHCCRCCYCVLCKLFAESRYSISTNYIIYQGKCNRTLTFRDFIKAYAVLGLSFSFPTQNLFFEDEKLRTTLA